MIGEPFNDGTSAAVELSDQGSTASGGQWRLTPAGILLGKAMPEVHALLAQGPRKGFMTGIDVVALVSDDFVFILEFFGISSPLVGPLVVVLGPSDARFLFKAVTREKQSTQLAFSNSQTIAALVVTGGCLTVERLLLRQGES